MSSSERWIMMLVGIAIGVGVLLFVIFGLGLFSGPEPLERRTPSEKEDTAQRRETFDPPREPFRPEGGNRRETPPAQESPSEKEAFGVLEGRVVTSKKDPVAGAEIQLYQIGTADRLVGGTGEPVGEMQWSGDDGFYRLRVPPGKGYILRANKDGYAEARMAGLAVEEGKKRSVRDLIFLVGGRIYGTVNDADGGPVAGARVLAVLQKQLGLSIDKMPGASAVTDGSGYYEIRHVPPGLKQVYAGAEGYATAMALDVTVEDAGPGKEVNFNLTRGRVITGYVYDLETNVGVEGAQVTASATQRRDPTRANTTTDESGYFELGGLSKYSFHVQARKKGYMPSHRSVATGGMDLEVFLTRNGGVQGQVIDAATGAPVPSFQLRYGPTEDDLSEGGASIQGIGRSVSFDDGTGNFEVYDLNPDTFVFEAWSSEHTYAQTEPITIGKGEWVSGVVIRLGRGGEVRGQVIGRLDGAAVPGVLVEVRPDDNRPPMILNQVNPQYVRSVRTDREGRFVVTGVGPGTHRVDLSHGDFMNSKSEPFEVADGASIDVGRIEILRGGTIEGYVRIADGTPVPFAQILINKVGGGYRNRAKTNSEGYYSLSKIPSGSYSVVIERVKGKMRRQVDLAAFGEQTVSLSEGETAVASF